MPVWTCFVTEPNSVISLFIPTLAERVFSSSASHYISACSWVERRGPVVVAPPVTALLQRNNLLCEELSSGEAVINIHTNHLCGMIASAFEDNLN